jgi:hypothetical protein
MTIQRRLAEMFEADRACTPTVWFKKFPQYEIDAELGARPWWPPLSEVWYRQGKWPPSDNTAASLCWPDAWAFLQRLHGDYLAARGRK